MSKMDAFTYLRSLGYSGTVSQMALKLRKDTTRNPDYYDETVLPVLKQEFTYSGDNLATVKENGQLVSLTYNTDGTVATDVRDGVTRVWVYSSGKLVSVTAV
jgi:hypothetical protein